jgi:peroxiredoxin
MKKYLLLFAVACAGALAFKPLTDVPEELAIGSAIPQADVKMKDAVSGKEFSLNDVKGKKGLVVVFTCNTCPFVKLYADRVKEACAAAGQAGLGFIYINSNEAYRDNEDSFGEMKKFATEQGYTAPYVVDVNSSLANAFGASKTPHVFVFDQGGKLAYRGGVDDNAREPGSVKEHYLLDAIKEIADGKKVTNNSTKSIGCSIKRKV